MPSNYLIHQVGKVASNTLQGILRPSGPGARVDRHHYLSDLGLARLERMCHLPGSEADGPNGISLQLAQAREQRADMESWEPGSTWILSGVRDPLSLAIAAFFQNLTSYCPWLSYDPGYLDEEADRLIAFFHEQFARMLSGEPPTNYNEALLELKLRGPGPWFDEEFNDFYGVDIYRHEIGAAPFVILNNDRFRFCVYRSESLSSSLPALLQRVESPPIAAPQDKNVGARKPYARLYQRFKERLEPSADMIAYYYGSKFFQHFYGSFWGALKSA